MSVIKVKGSLCLKIHLQVKMIAKVAILKKSRYKTYF